MKNIRLSLLIPLLCLFGTQYTGRLDVLNGVPYGITAICTPKETAQP